MDTLIATLDEKALRTPEWNEAGGRWVQLADGQEWLLKSPVIEVCPMVVAGEMTLSMATDFGPEFDAMVTGFEGEILTMFRVAAMMLRPFYAIADDDLGLLLRWRKEDEAASARLDAIMGVATGRDAPKPTPGGSDVASSS